MARGRYREGRETPSPLLTSKRREVREGDAGPSEKGFQVRRGGAGSRGGKAVTAVFQKAPPRFSGARR